LGERRQEALRIAGRQMRLERQPREWAQSLDCARWKPLVRHKVAVENVEVEEIDAGGLDAPRLLAKPGMVGIEQGRP